jgi:hypothetical protein
MKDVFAKRARASFAELLGDLADSFTERCSLDLGEFRKTSVETWLAAMDSPLKKGCAKYAKAVHSILGSTACVYHAASYHDSSALTTSCDLFAPLSLKDHLPTLSSEDTTIFWQYIDELNAHAYTAVRKTPPRVPTKEEIATDIAKRKNVYTAAGSSNGPVLQNGLLETWFRLCGLRDVKCEAPKDVPATLFTVVNGTNVMELCRARDPAGFEPIVAAFPYLTERPPTDEEWALLDKALSLATMDGNIPAPMMRGIEDVANELVADIQNGKTSLNTLDIESIGKRVLANVSSEEMSSFANNLDKILPAIQNM